MALGVINLSAHARGIGYSNGVIQPFHSLPSAELDAYTVTVPETGFEEAGRITNDKSACTKRSPQLASILDGHGLTETCQGRKSAFGKLAVSRPEFACFRHVTDRRSEKKLGLKLVLMGKSTGDLVRSQAGSFSSI